MVKPLTCQVVEVLSIQFESPYQYYCKHTKFRSIVFPLLYLRKETVNSIINHSVQPQAKRFSFYLNCVRPKKEADISAVYLI